MDIFIEMKEEILNASTIIYMRRTGAYGKDNYALMETFKDWLKTHNLYGGHTVILAIPLDNPNITEASKCRYDVCTTAVADKEIVSDKVKTRQLDGGKYIIFRIEHTAKAIQIAWESYLAELEKYNYSQDTSRPIIERYAKEMVNHHYCELCVPVL